MEHLDNLLLGLILSGLIGLLAYRRGSLAPSGALGAVLVGTPIFGFGGWTRGLTLIPSLCPPAGCPTIGKRQKRPFLLLQGGVSPLQGGVSPLQGGVSPPYPGSRAALVARVDEVAGAPLRLVEGLGISAEQDSKGVARGAGLAVLAGPPVLDTHERA